MAKRMNLKLKLSRVLPFQLCRSKHDLQISRPRTTFNNYRLSPVNTKVVDIPFPRLPSPPPSTPVDVVSVGCGCRGNRKETRVVRVSEEGEMLLSPSRSFSDDSLSFKLPSLESRSRRIKKMRKARRGGTWKDNKATVTVTEGNSNNKVMGGVAVVKTSEDPYEDFKRSMLEMILESEMFEAEELEELLQCFLSLNSRNHHAVIVEAFTEIWGQLFCASPDPYTNTNNT